MSKNDKQDALAPRLRFPEFRDKGGWKRRPLTDVLSEHGLKSTGVEQVYSVSVHKGLVNQIEHLGRSFSASSTDHYNRVLPGDIVYTKSPTGDFPLGIIKQNKTGSSVIVSPLYGIFSPESIALGVILDAYFESPENAKYYLEPLVQKGAKNTINVNNSKFLSGTLILPLKKEEQQKIADCLGSLDDVIAAESRKLAALRDHKQGLMQQLFPREGETVPRLRFPKFQDAAEWMEKPLGEFIEEFREKSSIQDEYEVLTSSRDGLVRQKDYYDNDRITGRDNIGFNVIPPGFITYRSRSDDRRFFFNENELGVTGIISTYYPVFSLNGVNKKFFIYLLNRYQLKVGKYSVGTSQTVLSLNELKKVELVFPKIDEQKRIADCLSPVDALIAAQAERLRKLRTHKRGLLQQLFPAPEDHS